MNRVEKRVRRARITAVWVIFLAISYFYWKWCAENVLDGKTIRAALIYFCFLSFAILALLAKIFRLRGR
ncbi:hypothetical protein K426_18240 [Sphingobium sp. TKS]|nr:hypothetical protein K426_18240 [Sphingobium sp. TKS]